MKNNEINISYDNSELEKKMRKEKMYRSRLYEEDKQKYKKEKQKFIYGVSRNFKQKRKNEKLGMDEIEKETIEAYEEGLYED